MEHGDSLDDAKRWAVTHEVCGGAVTAEDRPDTTLILRCATCGGAIEIDMRPTIALAQAGLLKPSEESQKGQALTAAMELAQHITAPALRERTLAELQKQIDEVNTAIRQRYGGNTTH